MLTWKNIIWIMFVTLSVTSANIISTTENLQERLDKIKWQETEHISEQDELERRPRSLIGDGVVGLQPIQTGAIPVVSNIQTVQNIPVISNVQTVQQVPIISSIQQQPIGGGLLGGIGGVGGVGGIGGIGGIGGAGIGGGFKRYHESYTVRARGFGGGLGLGKFGLGGLGGGGFGAGGLGGRYKAHYTKSYGGAFGGAGLIGAGGLGAGGGFLG